MIPPAVRVIEGGAFDRCSELTIVVLGKGWRRLVCVHFTDAHCYVKL